MTVDELRSILDGRNGDDNILMLRDGDGSYHNSKLVVIHSDWVEPIAYSDNMGEVHKV